MQHGRDLPICSRKTQIGSLSYVPQVVLLMSSFHALHAQVKLNKSILVASLISQDLWLCIHSHLHLQASLPKSNSSSNLSSNATCLLKPFLIFSKINLILEKVSYLLISPSDMAFYFNYIYHVCTVCQTVLGIV